MQRAIRISGEQQHQIEKTSRKRGREKENEKEKESKRPKHKSRKKSLYSSQFHRQRCAHTIFAILLHSTVKKPLVI